MWRTKPGTSRRVDLDFKRPVYLAAACATGAEWEEPG
jgi:hypothetical protein